jgi:hypothetical protein
VQTVISVWRDDASETQAWIVSSDDLGPDGETVIAYTLGAWPPTEAGHVQARAAAVAIGLARCLHVVERQEGRPPLCLYQPTPAAATLDIADNRN